MDAKSFPLVDLYCEDKIAKKIIMKGILFCAEQNDIQKLNELINIIPIGSADDVYKIFKSQMETYPLKKIRSGYACILDGDMKLKQNRHSQPLYPAHQNLHFIYSNESPEKFLTRFYLARHPNVAIQYYLDNVNNHYFFQSIIENSALTDEEEVFNCCWNLFKDTSEGENYLNELSSFIFQVYEQFSREL